MNGIRSAAAIGGSTALRIAIRSAVTSAPLKPSTEMPGSSHAAISSAAAVSTQVEQDRQRPVAQPGRLPAGLLAHAAGVDTAGQAPDALVPAAAAATSVPSISRTKKMMMFTQ